MAGFIKIVCIIALMAILAVFLVPHLDLSPSVLQAARIAGALLLSISLAAAVLLLFQLEFSYFSSSDARSTAPKRSCTIFRLACSLRC